MNQTVKEIVGDKPAAMSNLQVYIGASTIYWVG